jgi:F-type H+-transporting ATPase subunit epsilon
METIFISLKILLPFKVFADIKNVSRVVIETTEGSYGLLPQRLDCVAALVPGIFTYETGTGGPHYIAVAEGVMVKAGTQVLVSVRNAFGGADLGKLGDMVKKDFRTKAENQKQAINVIAKLERGFIYNLDKLRS